MCHPFVAFLSTCSYLQNHPASLAVAFLTVVMPRMLFQRIRYGLNLSSIHTLCTCECHGPAKVGLFRRTLDPQHDAILKYHMDIMCCKAENWRLYAVIQSVVRHLMMLWACREACSRKMFLKLYQECWTLFGVQVALKNQTLTWACEYHVWT